MVRCTAACAADEFRRADHRQSATALRRVNLRDARNDES
jgi:hypothetical protein